MESFDAELRIERAFRNVFESSLLREIQSNGSSLQAGIGADIMRLQLGGSAALEARRTVGMLIPTYCFNSVVLTNDAIAFLKVFTTPFDDATDVPAKFFAITINSKSITNDLEEMFDKYHVSRNNVFELSNSVVRGLQAVTHLILISAQRAYNFALQQISLPSFFIKSFPLHDEVSVSFVVDGGLLSPRWYLEDLDLIETHALVLLALEDLYKHKDNLFIHNIDPELKTYIDEYRETFYNLSPTRDILLYMQGYKIHLCVEKVKRRLGQFVDEDVIIRLQILLVAHEAYIYRFSRVATMIEDQNKIRAFYHGTSDLEKRALLARKLSSSKSIFDTASQITFINAANVATERRNEPENVPESILNAVLTGAAHGMTTVLLVVKFSAISISLSVLGNAATDAVSHTHLYNDIIAFFNSNYTLISNISKETNNLAWLSHLLDIVQRL